jgi:hypothetical protein
MGDDCIIYSVYRSVVNISSICSNIMKVHNSITLDNYV